MKHSTSSGRFATKAGGPISARMKHMREIRRLTSPHGPTGKTTYGGEMLGTSSVVLPVVLPCFHVPEGVSTGAMSLLTADMSLQPWTLYIGIPARPVRQWDSAQILEAAIR
jgi:hypothetical protein